jgi:hypothetical protein
MQAAASRRLTMSAKRPREVQFEAAERGANYCGGSGNERVGCEQYPETSSARRSVARRAVVMMDGERAGLGATGGGDVCVRGCGERASSRPRSGKQASCVR